MYAIWSALAPWSASQPPTVTIATSAAEISRSRTTTTRVSFDAVLRRFGCSILTPGSAIAERPYNLAAACAALAGVAELVDARGLGPRGHKPWGFESLRPHISRSRLKRNEPVEAS